MSNLAVKASRFKFERAEFGESQEIVEQRFQSRTLLDHGFSSLKGSPRVRRGHGFEVFVKQLHVHDDDGEWVLDFMRKGTGQTREFVVAFSKSIYRFHMSCDQANSYSIF